MNNPWEIYDELIDGISETPTVKYYQGGYNWSRVISSEGTMGMAMTIPILTRETISTDESLTGKSLKDVAKLVKSWNLVEAAIGHAAINCWYNHLERVEKCGIEHPGVTINNRDAFDVYSEDVQDKKVAIVGHFPYIEKKFEGKCQLSILERNPNIGDFIDSACEYILPEQDYVFATASTFVNKTMPRLLELSKNAKYILVGPSTPLTSILFDHGVHGLSGIVVNDVDRMEEILKGASMGSVVREMKRAGRMVDFMRG